MPPPVMEVESNAGQKVSRLREPRVRAYGSRGRPVSIDDENWRQTLTLNLVLNQMNVAHAPHRLDSLPTPLGRIMDSNRNWFLVRNWRRSEWTSFVRDFERVTERFWNRRFMLVPPASYDGMNWPRRSPTHRPNVITRFDLDIQSRASRTPYPIIIGRRPVGIWKLATRRDLPGPHGTLTGMMAAAARDIGRRDFRSSASTLIRADAYAERGETAIHEVGHLTGQDHPGQWRHVRAPGCRDGSEHACYVGDRQEHEDNIMGTGRGILPENADPWREFIAQHTSTREQDWHVFIMDNQGGLPTPVSLAPQTATRAPTRVPHRITSTP